MVKKSKPNAGPQDGNFERYIEELVKQSPATPSKTFDQSTVFPGQTQLPSTSNSPIAPVYPPSGTNQAGGAAGAVSAAGGAAGSAGAAGAIGATGAASSAATTAQPAPQDSSAAPNAQNQQPKVYIFDLKKSILNVLFIWVILGSMCYVIMPPEKYALSFSLVFFLGLICLVLNIQRHNKPLPTRQETINKAGQAVLKRIIMFFVKE